MAGLFSCSSVRNLIEDACAKGYEYAPFAAESLGYGSFVLIAPEHPDPKKEYLNIVVEEVCLNEWSSGHKVWRCRKISKNLQRKIDKYARECDL